LFFSWTDLLDSYHQIKIQLVSVAKSSKCWEWISKQVDHLYLK